MKHVHLLMVALTLMLFAYSSAMIISKKPLSGAYQVVSHTVYLGLVISGAYLLWALSRVAGVQYWAYAKIFLLIFAIFVMIKARKNPANVKVNIGLAWVSLAGILGLAIIKPVLF